MATPGSVTSLTITTAGSYVQGTNLFPTIVSFSSGAAAATATASVTGINSLVGGSNYGAGTTVVFSAPATPGGVTATGTATVAAGVITAITITNPGSGYTSYPTIAFQNVGSGSGASANSNVSVTGVVITNPGSGYTAAPTVAFSTGTTTAAATTVGVAAGGLLITSGSIQASVAAMPSLNDVIYLNNASFTIGSSANANALTFAGAIVGLPGTSNSLTVNNFSATTTLSGTIFGNVAVTMNANTTATLVLSGTNNTFTGGTTLLVGTLQLNNGTAAGTGTLTLAPATVASQLTAGAAIILYNPVVMNAATVTLAGSNAFTFDGPTTLGASFGTLNLQQSATFNGIIGGTTSLVLAGTSGTFTLTLNNANSYAGNTTLAGTSTLVVGNNNALSSGTLTLASGTFQANVAVTLSNNVEFGNSASVTIGGTVPLTFAGSLTMSGSNTITVSNTGGTTIAGSLVGTNTLTFAPGPPPFSCPMPTAATRHKRS